MPARDPFARFLLGAGAVCGAVIALIGGVALRGSGVIAVVLAGAVAACLAAGVARESADGRGRSPWDAAVRAGSATVGVLLVLSGTAAVAGGLVAVLVGAAAAVLALMVWLLRGGRPRVAGSRPAAGPALPGMRPVLPQRPVAAAPWQGAASGPRSDPAGTARLSAPVTELPTDVLGREWLRSTAALTGRLEPAARESIVRRRQEALDELERRDPDGFARWLAAGPAPGSDPALYVHGDPAGGSGA